MTMKSGSFDSPKLYLFTINPISTEGSVCFGLQQPKAVWHLGSFMAGVTKIHDFVYVSICLVPVKLFLKKKNVKFWKIENSMLLE